MNPFFNFENPFIFHKPIFDWRCRSRSRSNSYSGSISRSRSNSYNRSRSRSRSRDSFSEDLKNPIPSFYHEETRFQHNYPKKNRIQNKYEEESDIEDNRKFGIKTILSSASGGPKYEPSDYKFRDRNIKGREELLNIRCGSTIYIGVEKISKESILEDIGHQVSNLLNPLKYFLPAGSKYFYHTSVFIPGKNNNGVVIEYGPFNGNHRKLPGKSNFPETHYYLRKEWFVRGCGVEREWLGLRLVKMSLGDFENKVGNEGGAYGGIINLMELYPSKANNRTIGKILEDMGGKEYYVNLKMPVWSAQAYNVISHNCQDFAGLFVREVGAIREGTSYYRELHNVAKNHIVDKILVELEKNEDDEITGVEKVPILGHVTEAVYGIGREIMDAFGQ